MRKRKHAPRTNFETAVLAIIRKQNKRIKSLEGKLQSMVENGGFELQDTVNIFNKLRKENKEQNIKIQLQREEIEQLKKECEILEKTKIWYEHRARHFQGDAKKKEQEVEGSRKKLQESRERYSELMSAFKKKQDQLSHMGKMESLSKDEKEKLIGDSINNFRRDVIRPCMRLATELKRSFNGQLDGEAYELMGRIISLLETACKTAKFRGPNGEKLTPETQAPLKGFLQEEAEMLEVMQLTNS